MPFHLLKTLNKANGGGFQRAKRWNSSPRLLLLALIEFSDLVALKKKLPNTSFVPFFTSNCYMNANRDLQVYRVGTHLLMTNPLENNIL